MAVFASETWSGVAAPIQYAAIRAYSLDEDIEKYVSDCAAIHGIRTRYIKHQLERLGINCTGGQGAFYLTANFDHWQAGLQRLEINSSIELASHLLEKYHIATLPGSDFGMPEKQYSLRLSTSYLDMETEFDSQRLFSLYKSGIEHKKLVSVENHPNTHAALNAFAEFIATISD